MRVKRERPGPMTRYLITRNLDKLVDICLREATQFINTNQTKLKALDQLKYTLMIVEGNATKHTKHIIKSLVKVSQLGIEKSEQSIRNIMQVLGFHVKADYYIPLVLEILTKDDDIKNSNKNLIIMLNLFGPLLSNLSQVDKDSIKEMIKMLAHLEHNFQEVDQGLLALFEIASALISQLPKFQDQQTTILFNILLNIQATKTIPPQKRQEASQIMKLLAKAEGFNTVAALHAKEVKPVLERIIEKKEYVHWSKTSKDRFKFDTIVRNCHSEAARYLPEIITIFEFMIHPQNDIELRMDTLVLIEYMLEIEALHEDLKPLSEQLMRKVLIASIQWKIGQPQVKIRKGGVINMISLIKKKIISAEQLLDCFKDLLANLKNCIADDWAPELRLACCDLLQNYLIVTREVIRHDELNDIYVLLLERLDDSKDQIRKKVTSAINAFFRCTDLKLFSSIIKYMIEQLFIHYDDNNEDIRDAVHLSLNFAARLTPQEVKSIGKSNLKKMKHREKCEELLQFCDEMIEERKQI